MQEAALLTPAARGAIATVGLRGDSSHTLIAKYFESFSKVKIETAQIGKILVGLWKADSNDPGEELVVGRRDANHWEIHCHGGVHASQRILNHLKAGGAEVVPWTSWIESANSLQEKAHQQLPFATTERTALHMLDQAQGCLTNELQRILTELDNHATEAARDRIDELVRFASVGLHLTQPWSIVLTGPPNVGKSSLVNRIAGYDRAIVSDTPGTTRDVLDIATAIDGWPVRFFDTAGIRESTEAIEQAGISRAHLAISTADCILQVRDACDWLESGKMGSDSENTILILNKIDRVTPEFSPPVGACLTCAVTGQGVEDLIAAISKRLVPVQPGPLQPMPFLHEQVLALEEVRGSIDRKEVDQAKTTIQHLIR